MTDTTDLSKTFPAGTAAHRIDESVRALTAGFRYRLLELEGSKEAVVAEEAEAVVNDICASQENLARALRVAGRFMTRQGVDVEGRDIEEEDRALGRFVADLQELATDFKSEGGCWTDEEWNNQQGKIYAGEELAGRLDDNRDLKWARGER